MSADFSHPEFIARIFGTVPEIAADRTQQNLSVIGHTARKYRVLKLLDLGIG
jgi:hypothetical protein